MTIDPVTSAGGRTDPEAAGALVSAYFEQHGRMVYALCRLLLRDCFEAEDAAQQSFLSAYRSILSGVLPDEPAAWLAKIARNECLSRLRRSTPDSLPLLDSDEAVGADVVDAVDQRAEMQILSEVLSELPPAQRRAVVLREFYGLSYQEVAAALGLSGAAVESLLFKGRRRLQDRLRPMRASAFTLPLSLHDSLAQALPGFSGGAPAVASGGVGGAVLAKLASTPVAVKVAVAVAAVGAGGALTVASVHQRPKLVAPRTTAPALVKASTSVKRLRAASRGSRLARTAGRKPIAVVAHSHPAGQIAARVSHPAPTGPHTVALFMPRAGPPQGARLDEHAAAPLAQAADETPQVDRSSGEGNDALPRTPTTPVQSSADEQQTPDSEPAGGSQSSQDGGDDSPPVEGSQSSRDGSGDAQSAGSS